MRAAKRAQRQAAGAVTSTESLHGATKEPIALRIHLSCVDHRGQLLESVEEIPWPHEDIAFEGRALTAMHRLRSGVCNGTVPWKKS